MKLLVPLRFPLALWLLVPVFAQEAMSQNREQTPRVALQPLAQQVRQVRESAVRD